MFDTTVHPNVLDDDVLVRVGDDQSVGSPTRVLHTALDQCYSGLERLVLSRETNHLLVQVEWRNSDSYHTRWLSNHTSVSTLTTLLDTSAPNYLLSDGGGVSLLPEPEAALAGTGRCPSARHCSLAVAQRDLHRLGH